MISIINFKLEPSTLSVKNSQRLISPRYAASIEYVKYNIFLFKNKMRIEFCL